MLIGCERASSEKTPPHPASPEVYMKDPAFRKMLKEREDGRRAIMKKFAATRTQYEATCAKDQNSAESLALKAQLDALNEEFNKYRQETTRLVGARLRSTQPKAK